jgi:hypothetical protein
VQQVEMLSELPMVEKSRPRARFLPDVFLILAMLANARIAKSQSSEFLATEGRICGTVLLKADHRAASQVGVKLKSHVAGIFRSILTDVEGHFEVRGLPRGTYEIVVDEPGYESTPIKAQVDGPSTEIVIYLSSSHLAETLRARDTISVRELQIPGKAREEDQKGLERLAKNDPAGGLSHFWKATLAEFGLGYLLYLEAEPCEAEKILRRGLEVDENSADGHAILGMTLLQLDVPMKRKKVRVRRFSGSPSLGWPILCSRTSMPARGCTACSSKSWKAI